MLNLSALFYPVSLMLPLSLHENTGQIVCSMTSVWPRITIACAKLCPPFFLVPKTWMLAFSQRRHQSWFLTAYPLPKVFQFPNYDHPPFPIERPIYFRCCRRCGFAGNEWVPPSPPPCLFQISNFLQVLLFIVGESYLAEPFHQIVLLVGTVPPNSFL